MHTLCTPESGVSVGKTGPHPMGKNSPNSQYQTGYNIGTYPDAALIGRPTELARQPV